MPVRIPRNERGKILVVLFFSILGSLSGFACRCRMVEFLSSSSSPPQSEVRREVSDDEIWGISFPIRLGSLFLDREGFSKIN